MQVVRWGQPHPVDSSSTAEHDGNESAELRDRSGTGRKTFSDTSSMKSVAKNWMADEYKKLVELGCEGWAVWHERAGEDEGWGGIRGFGRGDGGGDEW